MELKDRVFNIKLLLKFCGGSVLNRIITDIRVGTFFAQLINNDDRFMHTSYTAVYPKFRLETFLNTDYNTYSYSIGFEYVYDNDRDGEYTEEYSFRDPDLEDTALPEIVLSGAVLEYSEVPDDIWEIIQNELYTVAMDRTHYRMVTEHLSAERINNEIREFAEELQRKEEETNV